MSCFSPLKGYKRRDNDGIIFRKAESTGQKMEVACGQCLGCRLDRSRMWAARIVHEASLYDENCFITLTYSPEHLPPDGSLRKKHFQKFMKRLRKRFSERKIRYFQVGEYGDKLDRPHYHACLFNFDFSFDQELLSNNDGVTLYRSKVLEELWPYGFCTVGAVTYESAAYCARYVTKKVTGKRADDHYLRCNEDGVAYWLQPEYITMSRGSTCADHRGMPYQVDCPKCSRGLGRDWYEKYKSDLFPSDQVPVPGRGVFKKVPTYYEVILGSENPEELEAIKERRSVFRDAHADEYSPQRLESKFKVKRAQLHMLKRGYEDET